MRYDMRNKRRQMMKINREKALAAFKEYTDRYDSSRDMIRLKIEIFLTPILFVSDKFLCKHHNFQANLYLLNFRRKRWILRG